MTDTEYGIGPGAAFALVVKGVIVAAISAALGLYAAQAIAGDGLGGGLIETHLRMDPRSLVMPILLPLACGMGFIYERFPGPVLLDGRFGYVLGMATDPEFRRRGHGRAIVEALLAWYRANGVRRVDLHATSDGEPLYREYGFTARYPGLTWVDSSP